MIIEDLKDPFKFQRNKNSERNLHLIGIQKKPVDKKIEKI